MLTGRLAAAVVRTSANRRSDLAATTMPLVPLVVPMAAAAPVQTLAVAAASFAAYHGPTETVPAAKALLAAVQMAATAARTTTRTATLPTVAVVKFVTTPTRS